MKKIWVLMDKLQEKMKVLAAICLMGMCAVTCADVFLRGAFNIPIYGSEEIVAIFATLAIALALPYSHIKDVHIGVEILVRLLSKTVQDRLKIATLTCSLAIMGVLTWRMFIYAGSVAESGERSMNLELPMHYLVYVLAFCFLIFALMILRDITARFLKE
ncbi:MAG: TRAP transporter small permease [Desulfobacter sp.]|nr:MAG: TRAP transporter small permease [Desulfobacter sp.]